MLFRSIRIGSCGGYFKELKLLDTILAENSYTESNFAYTLNNDNCHFIHATSELNSIIEQTALTQNIEIQKGDIFCSDVFDKYVTDSSILINRFPKEYNIIAAEMESFALFYIANMLHKQSACLLTVVDTIFDKRELSSEEREKSLNNMIKLALESSII